MTFLVYPDALSRSLLFLCLEVAASANSRFLARLLAIPGLRPDLLCPVVEADVYVGFAFSVVIPTLACFCVVLPRSWMGITRASCSCPVRIEDSYMTFSRLAYAFQLL